jgi:prolyl 4-hydroxylase
MKKYWFSDEWKDWIWSNIKNGISKQRIYDDLIECDYDVITVINELRFIPEIFRKKDEIHPNQVISQLEKSEAKKIDVTVPFYQFENFLTKMECDKIIELQINDNTRSTIADKKDKRIDETRTSYTTYFELTTPKPEDDDIIQKVKKRILSLMGIPAQYSESIQGQWYKENGLYHDHYDACDDYNQFKHYHGNRTWTCMITLNEVEEGGETYFPKLNTRFKPAIGQALIWYNLDNNGLAHPLTLHTGQLVKKGEKFIITQWFHQCSND